MFDGPEDRNGLRNFDEIRFWLDYTQPGAADHIVDDAGNSGGIAPGASFVIAGDFNADPQDGDSVGNAIGQLLQAPWIEGNCVPLSEGAETASQVQGGVNQGQRGKPAADTADFNDQYTGNLRLDYLLPSSGSGGQGLWRFLAGERRSGSCLGGSLRPPPGVAGP